MFQATTVVVYSSLNFQEKQNQICRKPYFRKLSSVFFGFYGVIPIFEKTKKY